MYCATERGNHHKTEHVRYSSVRTVGCKRLSSHQLKVLLQVPAGPPSDCMSSTVCRIRYEVEVRTDVGNCHDFPVARIPVTIGTFPLLDSVRPGDDPRISVVSYDPGRRSQLEEKSCLMKPHFGSQICRRTSRPWR